MKYRNVLVVDDCPVTRRRIVKELNAVGYNVRTAPDGLTALQLLRDSCPDFVVTDWQMPNIEGDVLCRCIRAQENPHYVYIILMTAYSDDLGVVQGLGAGADDYICKPIDPRELIAHMDSGARVLELDRRLTYVAQHDPLTGALNRLNLMSNLSTELELGRRRQRPLSCIMVDLDRFKRVNDELGHLVGDCVLRSVAEVLRAQFRNNDYVSRYGGEEFCIALPGSTEEGAAACAERCRRELESMDVSGLPKGVHVTASFGVAETENANLSPAQLIERADQALLVAKREGRNRVIRFSELDEAVLSAFAARDELPPEICGSPDGVAVDVDSDQPSG